jgi:hypothetical protein
VKARLHLVFDANGVRRMVKNLPALRSGEFAVRVNVTVPDSFFARPLPVAEVVVPEGVPLQAVEVRIDEGPIVAAVPETAPAEEGAA